MKYLITLTILFSMTLNAQAYSNSHTKKKFEYNPLDCIRTSWTLLETIESTPEECKLTKELKLKEELFSFPAMNVGPIKVRFWEAQFDKGERTTRTYRLDYVNICYGYITHSEIRKLVEAKTYDLVNPNLDSSITETYNLAPMTESEAKISLKNLELDCQQSRQI